MDKAILKRLLSIDTATEVCSAAIQFDGQVFYRESAEPRSHAKLILPMIESLIKDAGCVLSELDGMAVTIGPGSFTGIRIGISVAQGLSYSVGLPLIGVSSLEILAQQGLESLESRCNGYIIPALDARMGEVYWASYRVIGGEIQEDRHAQVSRPEELNNYLYSLSKGENTMGLGHGWALESVKKAVDQYDSNAYPKASAALVIAQSKPLQHSVIEPLYLRNEVSWEKRKKVRKAIAKKT